MAVYPFTPQQVISQAIISASPMPVFCGVGGGTTKGMRSVIMAQDIEAQGAYGAVVNSPISNSNIRLMKSVIDIPIIATVVTEEEDVQARIDAARLDHQRGRRQAHRRGSRAHQRAVSVAAHHGERWKDRGIHPGHHRRRREHHRLHPAFQQRDLQQDDG